MRFYKRLGTIMAVIVLATLLTPPVTSVTSTASASTCWKWKKAERKFHRKMNRARNVRLINKLRLSRELSRVARVHTRDMARKQRIFHQPSSQLGSRVVGWTLLGENVGVGSRVNTLHKAFMNSPAHRANILRNTFRFVGVGTKRNNGRMYVTVVFSAVNKPGTTLRMPRC